MMRLQHDVGIIGVGERLHRFVDGIGVGLGEQARVPVVRVDDRPIVRVIEITLPVPNETGPALPVARRFLGGIFESQFTDLVMLISVERGVLVSHPLQRCRFSCQATARTGCSVATMTVTARSLVMTLPVAASSEVGRSTRCALP